MERQALEEYIIERLREAEAEGEARSIARLLSAHLIEGFDDCDRKAEAEKAIARILRGEPVQYVLGYTWFYNIRLNVNKYVLIPRPETEELVAWIIKDLKSYSQGTSLEILDIGTGSGCIAIALAKELPAAQVTAMDVSAEALGVAEANAVSAGVRIRFQKRDFLKEGISGTFDVIACNPPYISSEELNWLAGNVRDHEPMLALTPSESDPLIFYRQLAACRQSSLRPDGHLYLELNEFRAHEIHRIFIDEGFETDMRKDMQGKWRMLKV